MDFVISLPRNFRGFDSIWVIVDRITKLAHYLPIKTTYNTSHYAKLYVDEIKQASWDSCVQYLRLWASIHVSFLEGIPEGLRGRLDLNTTFHFKQTSTLKGQSRH